MNELTIAVAGARKTQGIVEACRDADDQRRILVIAYTQASQAELESRIADVLPLSPQVEVLGWYAFLLRHFVSPYLPLLFPGHSLRGFNYEGEPHRAARDVDAARFLDPEERAYQCNLASLAHKVHEASDGSVLDRLEHIYTDIYIDEAQDIGGWALEILKVLFASKLDVHLVGDMRQALLSTNPRDNKNSPYRFEKVLTWYREREAQGQLKITQKATTHRSSQVIADLSDRLFDPSLKYAATISASTETHFHHGLYRVSPQNVAAYVEAHAPLSIHYRAGLGDEFGITFTTFGVAKGRTVDHVLLLPTEKFRQFLKDGTPLVGKTACAFYIGVTRAKHSVAVILDPSLVADEFTPWKAPTDPA
ncbi:UvrD-helicase domain-containing protein [Nocardioides nanhaiensis]|uniref:AAA family ATPase n=1 Tax=Nocardioides nanhaiensis TaxID=1476871 RepID=A0ABP8W996_9ACTN